MPTDHREQLRQIRTFPSLVKYLRDHLDWPIDTENFDDLTFDYEPEELGLDRKTAAKIEGIKQLRPMTTHQPWGIFFVKFEPKKLPVVALRRILGQLVFKKRASANKAERPTWNMHDLLFVSSYGEGSDRQICLAHFSEDPQTNHLATLKVLGWDGDDTGLHLDHVHHELQTKLRWPGDTDNAADWRETWSSAFTLRHHEVIATSQELAVALADLAGKIRKKVNAAIKIETDKGKLRKLLKAFQESLIHDLDEDDFADMYAQTISYGLLSAAISRVSGALVADDVAQMVPVTSPFLRELMETFLNVGGRKRDGNGQVLDFDELGVNDVVETLRAANMEAVLRDFDNRNPQEDPVIHFYELFLKEYDAAKRMQRGVFYTPKPVVSYIVRSVHELLQTEFGLLDGLADTTTWAEIANRKSPRPSGDGPGGEGGGESKGFSIPEGVSPDQPFVQILDPALGTGTFLVEVIEVIHQTMTAKWRAAGHSAKKIDDLWNNYVPGHLLPRLYGFELMMAPYAIAHMKIGLKLAETGYRCRSDERARVYLTNSLEPAMPEVQQKQIAEMSVALAHEAKAVTHIKRHGHFTVVIGNPPYAGHSVNTGEWISTLVRDYYQVDSADLGERNSKWLQDDYVKFFRAGQYMCCLNPCAVFGFITNHGYIDNPTFRGMRQSLLASFREIWVLDLHGNVKKKETSLDRGVDENVFDIQQGVAIFLAARGTKQPSGLKQFDLFGIREQKYRILTCSSAKTLSWRAVKPVSPFYVFLPQNEDVRTEYLCCPSIKQVMPVNVLGFQTHRDHFAIAFDRESIVSRCEAFRDSHLNDAELKTQFELSDNRDWCVRDARRAICGDPKWKNHVIRCLYRPFDMRWCYFSTVAMDYPRRELLDHVAEKENLCLLVPRQISFLPWQHTGVSDTVAESCLVSTKTKEQNYNFPLYLYPERNRLVLTPDRCANFSEQFLRELAILLKAPQKKPLGLPTGLTPENVFHYIYAVFHSPGYRSRYAEFLKIDFPRLPLTGSLELFRELARLGGKLVALHLLESPKLDTPMITYVGPAKPEVGRVGWSQKTVWLDAPAARRGQPTRSGTVGFRGVPEEVWNFQIGGYQVCHKWLKDRKGRTLSKDDIAHYQKIVVALSETIRLMAEIDEVIDQHGGWPGAFVTEPVAESTKK